MNGLMQFMEKYIIPGATKIGTQKHLVAVRDGFVSTMPITMAGSVAVLLNVFVRDLPREWGWDGFVNSSIIQFIIGLNGHIWLGSLAIIAVVFAVTLGANIAKAYDVDSLSGSIVSLSAFIMGLTQSANLVREVAVGALTQDAIDVLIEAGISVTEAGESLALGMGGWGFFQFSAHFGAPGLFTALFSGLVAVIVFSKLMLKKLVIKLPESVPPAVARAFAAIVPATIALYLVALINWSFNNFAGMPMITWIAQTIQEPLINLSQGFGAVLLLVFLVHLLWFFGLHGTNILAPIFQTLYGTAMNENVNAHEMGLTIPHNWVAGSFEAFVWPGGAGVTLMLILAIVVLSKRADSKTIGKLALAPGVFNINEPVMFGMPIVLNPIYMIPFIVAPMLTASIAFFATHLGFVNPIVVPVLWVMPAGISGFLGTAGDWRAIILTIVNLGVAFLVWAPFVLAANKMSEENV